MTMCVRSVTLLGCLLIAACVSKTRSPTDPSTTDTATPPAAPAGPTIEVVRLGPGPGPRPPFGWYAPGATIPTRATATFSDGSSKDVTESCTDWQSDNTFVLTINNQGLLTAHNTGSSTITTTCEGVAARGLVPLNVMPAALWTRSGTGAAMINDMPPYVRRLRITANSSGRTATSFAVLTNGLLVIEQTLQRNVPYVGTHAVRAPANIPTIHVQVADSLNTTAWTLTEAR